MKKLKKKIAEGLRRWLRTGELRVFYRLLRDAEEELKIARENAEKYHDQHRADVKQIIGLRQELTEMTRLRDYAEATWARQRRELESRL